MFLIPDCFSFHKCNRKITGHQIYIIIVLRYQSNWQILQNRIISFIVLSSDNTNCKNDIQLFPQLFDELSVHTDYH